MFNGITRAIFNHLIIISLVLRFTIYSELMGLMAFILDNYVYIVHNHFISFYITLLLINLYIGDTADVQKHGLLHPLHGGVLFSQHHAHNDGNYVRSSHTLGNI